MPTLDVRNLTKKFGKVVAVDDASFEVKDGQLLTLLGPSGCGKTTTLLCIAGLEKPDQGKILVGGSTITDVENGIYVRPENRNMGMVFQFYALWPHMTVYDNVAYALKLRKMPKDTIKQKVKATLDLVELSGFEDRYPYQLSGGQQQRVALARALVYEPEILLLDEPLSNLDAKLRERARFWLRELQKNIGITTIYVTHDQIEAMVLSDQVLIMNKGKIVQMGTPREVYLKPKSPFAADFLGTTNFLEGVVRKKPNTKDKYWVIDLDIGYKIRSTSEADLDVGDRTLVSVRSEDIELFDENPKDKVNVLLGQLSRSAYLGSHYQVWIHVGDKEIRIETKKCPKKKVYLYIPEEKAVLLPMET